MQYSIVALAILMLLGGCDQPTVEKKENKTPHIVKQTYIPPPPKKKIKLKDIDHFGIIAFGPDVMTCGGVDELGVNPYTVIGPAHAAFKHVSHSELFRDLPNLHGLPLVGKCRVTSNDKEAGDA